MHNSLRDIWNGTEEGFSPDEKSDPNFKDTKHHLTNIKEALEILLDLQKNKTTVHRLVFEKITEDIVGSFNLIKSNPAEIENWIANEYPRAVI